MTKSKALQGSLWGVQGFLCVLYVGTGLWKLLTPIPKLAAMIPWAGEVPAAFLQMTGVFDLCGGIGILLPALTRIRPGLSVLAALGCSALQASAIVFHLGRGEAANTWFNFLMLALSGFVFWGRRGPARIAPRQQRSTSL